ncbi:major facilitator superfamily domain-containing protein [Pseudomassariella vexata]|uniref:Major facilitator superfamily domain-containing protein n=1 Tax=Pseudomassariella vexata TaxID=1141098 RepID=A0A1Y2DP22_9PEZI|nr:major facilitator superfamily domain-containing protein [Pseudomassariella vexata]ORY60914.1 major facilitator superfamily domain-containing protein [Pseudomassariella vexata]
MLSSTSSTSAEGGVPPDLEQQAAFADVDQDAPPGDDEGEKPTENSPVDGEEQWTTPPEPVLSTDVEGPSRAVSRVLSRISTKSSSNPGPPPDGGHEAWLACLCTHFVIMNTWGFINSFGIFQSYYATVLDRPPSDISWIGSLQIWLTFFVGTFTGRLTDGGLFRPVLMLGTVLITIGIFTTSAATQYWQLILSQGLCMGLGSGCVFTPAISTVSTYFHKKRSLAIGIAASGSVTGGLVFPAMARQLLPTVGLGWAVRAMGFVSLTTMVFANFFMRSRLPPRTTGSLVEWGAFKELEYTFYAVGMFFNFWSIYFAFFYIASFSRTAISPPLTYTDSLNLLLLMNGIGVIGRLLPNYFSDRTGPLNMMIPTCLICGIALLSWMAVETPTQLYAWSVIYGIAAGSMQSLFPAGLSSLTTDLRKQGTRMGMVFTIVSFAVLTGNPIAGAIITAEGGGYRGAQVFTGCSVLVGMGCISAARVVRQRRTEGGWALKI